MPLGNSRKKRHQPERKRALIETDWEHTFDIMSDYVAIIDRNHRLVRVNQAMAIKLGIKPEEAVGLSCFTVMHGSNSPPPHCPFAAVMRDGREHTAECSENRMGGDFSITVSPQYDHAGEIIGCVHIARNITEQKRAADALRRQQEYFQKILQAITHPLYVIDARTYAILLSNSASGFDDAIGEKTCYALTHKQDKPCGSTGHPCPLLIVKETKKPTIVEHRHFNKKGVSTIVEVYGYPLLDDEGNVAQMIEYSIDVTERRQEDAERERLLRDKMNALSSVKTLRGLLPICASCKKIRDDKGYWSQIEAYIKSHSEAEFSHGICPECAKKLYPAQCVKTGEPSGSP